MKPEIKAVLFDLDGTLVDTAPDMVAALNILLENHNQKPLPYEEGRCFVSQGAVVLINKGFKRTIPDNEMVSLREEYLRIYAKISSSKSVLFPNMDKVLEYIESNKLPWGVVTNKPHDLAYDLLKKMKLYDRMGSYYAADTLPKKKPEPDQLLAASKDIDIDPKHILYLGDDERDIIAAKAAGMPNGVMNYGYINTTVPPLDWAADFYFDDALEILTLLKPTIK